MTVRNLAREEIHSLVGQSLGTSRWIEIDQDMITSFGILTLDRQWIHLDVERAQRDTGGTIAHGFLTLAMLSTMRWDIWAAVGITRAVNYGFNKVRFPAPVRCGDAIRLHETLVEAKDQGRRLLMTAGIEVEVRNSERPAVAGEWLALLEYGE